MVCGGPLEPANPYKADTPAGMAIDVLRTTANDAYAADPTNPGSVPKRLVAAIHMCTQLGIPFSEINDVVNGGRA
jgi:hypothetical protein